MLSIIIGGVGIIFIIVIIYMSCSKNTGEGKKDLSIENSKELRELEEPMIQNTQKSEEIINEDEKEIKEEDKDLNNIPKNTITQIHEIKVEETEVKSDKKTLKYKPQQLNKADLEEENEEEPKIGTFEDNITSIPVGEDIVQQEVHVEEKVEVEEIKKEEVEEVKEEEADEVKEESEKKVTFSSETKEEPKQFLSKSVAVNPGSETINEEELNTPEKNESQPGQTSSKSQKKRGKKKYKK